MHTMEISRRKYSPDNHKVWNVLFPERKKFLEAHACPEYLQGLEDLGYRANHIPDLDDINKKLRRWTGWTIVPVPGLVDEAVLWDATSQRFLPAISSIRPMEHIGYAPNPDGIHDLIGHVPYIANPHYAVYMEAMGQRGCEAVQAGYKSCYDVLYPFAEEFPLGYSGTELKIFGPALFSAEDEGRHALAQGTVRRKYDPEEMLRTDFHFDELQEKYFVYESFEHMCAVPEEDFMPLYRKLDLFPAHKGEVVYRMNTVDA